MLQVRRSNGKAVPWSSGSRIKLAFDQFKDLKKSLIGLEKRIWGWKFLSRQSQDRLIAPYLFGLFTFKKKCKWINELISDGKGAAIGSAYFRKTKSLPPPIRWSRATHNLRKDAPKKEESAIYVNITEQWADSSIKFVFISVRDLDRNLVIPAGKLQEIQQVIEEYGIIKMKEMYNKAGVRLVLTDDYVKDYSRNVTALDQKMLDILQVIDEKFVFIKKKKTVAPTESRTF